MLSLIRIITMWFPNSSVFSGAVSAYGKNVLCDTEKSQILGPPDIYMSTVLKSIKMNCKIVQLP